MKLKIRNKSKYRKKFIDIHLINTLRFYYSSIRNKNLMQIKTHSRSSTIFPCFEKMTINVHNGKKFVPFLVQEHHLGFKFGQFVFTRKFSGHKKDGRKVVYKKKKNTPRSSIFHEMDSKNILNNKLKYINLIN